VTALTITMEGGQGHLNVHQLIRQWSPLVTDLGVSSLTVDMAGVGFMAPCAMVTMRSAMQHALVNGALERSNITVVPPAGSNCAYLDRMDVFREIVDLPITSGRREPEGFAPAADFVDDEDVAQVAKDLATQAGFKLPKVAKQMLEDVALELGKNAVDHAGVTSTGGVVAGQRWKTQGITEIAIADTGCGIISSLRMNPQYASVEPAELITKICQNGVSATGVSGRGTGLLQVAEYVDERRGSLAIYTGPWCHERTDSGTNITHSNDTQWEGTLVIWRIPTLDQNAARVRRNQ
jgi:hypothetical protein